MVGPNRQTTKDTKSQEENASWSTQIMVVYHENHARYGPILTAGVLLLSHFEKDSQNVDEINWYVLLDTIPVDASFEGGTLTHTPSNFILLGPGVGQADNAVEVGFTYIHQTGLQATDLLK